MSHQDDSVGKGCPEKEMLGHLEKKSLPSRCWRAQLSKVPEHAAKEPGNPFQIIFIQNGQSEFLDSRRCLVKHSMSNGSDGALLQVLSRAPLGIFAAHVSIVKQTSSKVTPLLNQKEHWS